MAASREKPGKVWRLNSKENLPLGDGNKEENKNKNHRQKGIFFLSSQNASALTAKEENCLLRLLKNDNKNFKRLFAKDFQAHSKDYTASSWK